tara:strand:- start:87 stop:518 length:432 start_codon:yes stop_codon:yes gene_type:complete
MKTKKTISPNIVKAQTTINPSGLSIKTSWTVWDGTGLSTSSYTTSYVSCGGFSSIAIQLSSTFAGTLQVQYNDTREGNSENPRTEYYLPFTKIVANTAPSQFWVLPIKGFRVRLTIIPSEATTTTDTCISNSILGNNNNFLIV